MKRVPRKVMVLFVLAQLSGLPLLSAPAAQAPVAKAAGPQARFAEPSVNFGKVAPTEARRHVFVVTNVGTEMLVITDVAPGCGCTTAGTWDREIPPGQTGRIPIEFNPANFSGPVSKSVVVTCNDPAQPTQVLEIQATVWRPFEVTPTFTSFLPVEGEPRNEVKIVRIVNNLEQPATLERPESNNPLFKAELKTIRPGREFELHVSYDSAVTGPSLNTVISVRTSLAEQSLLNVSAFAMPQPAVITIPATIQLPPGPLGPNYTYNVVIRNNGEAALQVTDPAASVASLVVKVTEPQPGRMFYVSVAIPAEFKASAENPPVISVKTSHPKFPQIRVPIVPAAPSAAPAVTSARE